MDEANLWIRSTVQFLYSMETPVAVTTDQTDLKTWKGETGSQNLVNVKPRMGGIGERWVTVRVGIWSIPWWTSVPGVIYPFKTQIYSWNRLRWSAVRAPSNSPNEGEDVKRSWCLIPPPVSRKPRFSAGHVAPCLIMLYWISALRETLVGQSPFYITHVAFCI